MPYTKEQIETLKATDPAIVKEALSKMDEGQRSELMLAIQEHSKPEQKQQLKAPEEGTLSRFGSGVASGVKRAFRALEEMRDTRERKNQESFAKSLGVQSPYDQEWYQKREQKRSADEQEFVKRGQESGTAGRVGQMVGQALPAVAATAAMPSSGTSLAARMALSGAQSYAGAYATTPGSEEERRKAGAVSGVIGAAGPLVAKGANIVANKALDKIAGTKLGNLFGVKTKVDPAFAGAEELTQKLESAGLKPTAADVTGDPALLAKQAALSRKDPDFMRFVIEQNKKLAEASDKVVSDLKSVVSSEKWSSLDDVVKAAGSGGKRAGAAKQLLTTITNSGDDWKEIAQQSGNLKLFLAKLKADANYDKVSQMSKQLGVNVKPASTLDALEEAIKNIKGNSAADSSTLEFLKKMHSAITSGEQNLTFEGMRMTKSSIGERIALARAGKAVAPSEVTVLEKVNEAIKGDIGSSLNKFPQLRDLYKKANLQYEKEVVVPYKDVAFSRALTATDPTAGARIFESLGDSAKQTRFFNMLDPKGQAAVRYGLIEKAVNAGEKAQKGVSGIALSPASIASQLEKMDKAGLLDVAFQGSERQAVAGLAKMMRTMDHYGTVGVPNTGTGVTSESIGAATKDLGMGKIAAKIFDIFQAGNFKKAVMDPRGRLLLVRASKMEPTDPKMVDLISKLSAITTAQSQQEGK